MRFALLVLVACAPAPVKQPLAMSPVEPTSVPPYVPEPSLPFPKLDAPRASPGVPVCPRGDRAPEARTLWRGEGLLLPFVIVHYALEGTVVTATPTDEGLRLEAIALGSARLRYSHPDGTCSSLELPVASRPLG